jgi:hypothetical protein
MVYNILAWIFAEFVFGHLPTRKSIRVISTADTLMLHLKVYPMHAAFREGAR